MIQQSDIDFLLASPQVMAFVEIKTGRIITRMRGVQ